MSERFTHREVGGDAAPLNGGTPKGKRRGQPAPVALWASAARGRALGRWATACCAAVVLAGCSGESAPTASSGDVAPSDMSRIASGNASSSKTTGASSSTSSNTNGQSREFVVPDAAKAHTHEGAKAFVKFYWETLAALDAHPTTGVLTRFATSDCQVCSEQESAIAKQVAEGTHVEDSAASVTDMKVHASSTADVPVIEFHLRLTAGEMVSKQGDRSKLESVSQKGAAKLEWEKDGWKLSAYGADQN